MATLTEKAPNFNTIEEILPSWWKPGATFKDEDGDTFMVLMPAGFREIEPVSLMMGTRPIANVWDIAFRKISHIYIMYYKGEASLHSLEKQTDPMEWLKDKTPL